MQCAVAEVNLVAYAVSILVVFFTSLSIYYKLFSIGVNSEVAESAFVADTNRSIKVIDRTCEVEVSIIGTTKSDFPNTIAERYLIRCSSCRSREVNRAEILSKSFTDCHRYVRNCYRGSGRFFVNGGDIGDCGISIETLVVADIEFVVRICYRSIAFVVINLMCCSVIESDVLAGADGVVNSSFGMILFEAYELCSTFNAVSASVLYYRTEFSRESYDFCAVVNSP